MNLWTSEEIEKILLYLEDRKLPFEKYCFTRVGEGLKLIGRGGFSDIYEAEKRKKRGRFEREEYCIKVTGFRDNVNAENASAEEARLQNSITSVTVNTVQVCDKTELYVEFDEQDNIINIYQENNQTESKRVIKLSFIVMEKLTTVIKRDVNGNVCSILGSGEEISEKEVLEFALDIGYALKHAHDRNILHRDVKLENVFYSEREKVYKLGDFGIAKETENGFAGTVAFTKGYVAPEVRTSKEKYDNTADIYSYGMMLYVIMNNYRFPDSRTYNVNASVQYQEGYSLPMPSGNISIPFFEIINKACRYDPNDRYQSMDEIIEALKRLLYGHKFADNLEDKLSYLTVAVFFCVLGMMFLKLGLASHWNIEINIFELIFLGICLIDGVNSNLKLKEKNYLGIKFIFLVIVLFTARKSIIKLVGYSILLLFHGAISMEIVIMMLVNVILTLFSNKTGIEMYNPYGIYMAMLCIPMAIVSAARYEFYNLQMRLQVDIGLADKMVWLILVMNYIIVVMLGFDFYTDNKFMVGIVSRILGPYVSALDKPLCVMGAGITGLIMCGYWVVREKIIKNRKVRSAKG